MHNRAKSTRNQRPSAEEQQRQQARTSKYKAAYHKVITAYKAGQYTAELLAHTAILIGINPDSYSLWNYRRTVLYYLLTGEHPPHPSATTSATKQHAHTADVTVDDAPPTSAPTSTYTHDWSIDLTLTEKSFHKNPKCYSAWYHRIWCIDVGQLNVLHELQVCDQMLKLDERNFHAWKHRRAVAARVDRMHLQNTTQSHTQLPLQPSIQHVKQHYFITPQQYITDTYHSAALIDSEFHFTRQCIDTNFSNFSAWHYRSQLLDMIIQQQAAGKQPKDIANSAPKISSLVTTPYLQLLDTEFELIKQALITQPSDQSPWLYYKWLIGKVMLSAGQQHMPNVGILSVERPEHTEAADTYDMPALDHVVAVLWRENALCEQILKLEPEAKYAILTRFQILSALQHYEWITAASPTADAGSARLKHESAYVAMMQLETYDSFRTAYYDKLLDRAEECGIVSEPSLDAHFREFCDAWQSLTHHNADQSQTLAIQIQHCYNDTHRKYHTWQHVSHCLQLVKAAINADVKLSTGELNELVIALWFHDVVYQPLTKDNERRSAELFQTMCKRHQPPDAPATDEVAVDRISQLINITAGHHSTATASTAEQLMCDIDLAILAVTEADFDQYDRNIRAEYSMVSAEAFRTGRIRVLQTFVDRPAIYATDWAQQQFEQPARRNLRRAIDKLQAG